MQTLKVLALSGLVLGLTACASNVPVGNIMTNVTLPIAATSNDGNSSKVGEATCNSVFAMFSYGDCSTDTAKKNGGITKVHHVDWHAKNFLGLFGTYKVKVYGD